MFELLGFTVVEFEHFLLIAMRMISIMSTIVFMGEKAIPQNFRAMLGFFLAMIVAPIIPPADVLPVKALLLIPLVFKEVLVGLAIGFTSKFLFESLNFAGFFAARLMNLTMLSLIDPASNENKSGLGQIFYMLALLFIFSINGHHFFINSIFQSFYLIPINHATFDGNLIPVFIDLIQDIFIIGIRISAPIMVILFLQRVLLALFSKVNPEMNIFIIGMPLAILVGLYLLTLYWPYFFYFFRRIFFQFKTDYLEVIKLFSGAN